MADSRVRIAWFDANVVKLTEAAAKRGVKKATFALMGNVDKRIKIMGHLGFASQTRRAIKEGKEDKIGRSEPGEPPRMQTGVLRDNIVLEFSEGGFGSVNSKSLQSFKGHPGGLIGRVGPDSDVPYGRALELGYKPNNLKPRPYLRPAFDETIKTISKHFKGQLRK